MMTSIKVRLANFPRITRRSAYSSGKKYTDFRAEIREDCQLRCVYCDSHEVEIGGQEMFHLDHFRPKKHFPKLETEPNNLVWACARCNILKRDKFPAIALGSASETLSVHGNTGFLDPFLEDRNDYFSTDQDGNIQALKHPARYVIRVLALDRPFLRLNRQRRQLALSALAYFESKELTARKHLYETQKTLSTLSTDDKNYELYRELTTAHQQQIATCRIAISTIEALV